MWNRVGLQLQTELEVLLAEQKVSYYGQPVAIIVAETEELALRIAKLVKVTYKNVSSNPPVLTIDEAKKDARRIFTLDKSIKPKGKGTNVTKVIKGIYEIEAQYHYYMEPMTAVVAPIDNTLEVYSSTHWIDITQVAIADCLNIKESE